MTETTVELDEPTREALDRYREATRERDEATERRDKAKAEVVAYLATHDAKVGTIDGNAACSHSSYDMERIDSGRLRAEEPYLFRRYAKLIHVESLRLRGVQR